MNFEVIPNRSPKIKKWEQLVLVPVLPLLLFSVGLGWIKILLGLLVYAILTQGFIYNLYRKEGRGKEFLIRMSVPLMAALVVLVFFGFDYFFNC